VTKDAGLAELVTATKAILRYPEDAVNYDDAKLTALAWGGKAVAALEAPHQGEGWAFLDWKEPAIAAPLRTRSSGESEPSNTVAAVL